MERIGWGLTVALEAVAGLVGFGGIALADNGACHFVVTQVSLASSHSSGGVTTFAVGVTVFDDGVVPGTFGFPAPTDPNIQNNPEALPVIALTDTQTGTVVQIPATGLLAPSGLLTPGHSASATYTFAASLGHPQDPYTVALVDRPHTDHVFHVYQMIDGALNDQDTAPVCNGSSTAPVGQLPEVPWAATLPLLGAGAVGWRWQGLRRRPQGRA
ncbi:MAG: hypothetical protein K6U14_00915 [Firmicutes bacterium]|nr:hypothetical protein [Alicyclobacillaceae bacterium]MCL6496179.1 hypothetical protein [Bacillota bacterium]